MTTACLYGANRFGQVQGRRAFPLLGKQRHRTTDPTWHPSLTEQQIVGTLKESEAGVKTPDLCRKHGISSATFYARKSKFGGPEVSDVAEMRALEDANRRLKRLLADSVLEIDALKLIASGSFWRLRRGDGLLRR